MSTSLRLFVLLVVAVLAVVAADDRLCGAKLSDAIHSLCKGHYQTMYDTKRSDKGIEALEGLNHEDWIFNYRQPLQSRFRRSPNAYHNWWVDGNIVEMCCKQSCTVEMLLNFCNL